METGSLTEKVSLRAHSYPFTIWTQRRTERGNFAAYLLGSFPYTGRDQPLNGNRCLAYITKGWQETRDRAKWPVRLPLSKRRFGDQTLGTCCCALNPPQKNTGVSQWRLF